MSLSFISFNFSGNLFKLVCAAVSAVIHAELNDIDLILMRQTSTGAVFLTCQKKNILIFLFLI